MLNVLIRSIGFSFKPQFLLFELEQIDGFQDGNAAMLVRNLIYRLAMIPTNEASKAFDELISDP